MENKEPRMCDKMPVSTEPIGAVPFADNHVSIASFVQELRNEHLFVWNSANDLLRRVRCNGNGGHIYS